MTKLAVIALLLAAGCRSEEDFRKEMPPPEEAPAAAAEKEPPPPPKKKELTPEELGTCTLEASGAMKFTQTSPGGRTATNVSYWYSAEERNKMMGVDGFAVHCHGADAKFSILPGGGKKDGMPFGPKKYTFKKGSGDASLMITFGPKLTLGDPSGVVDVTRFDKQRIVGTIDLSGKLVPGGGTVKLTGSFDYACPGFSGCE